MTQKTTLEQIFLGRNDKAQLWNLAGVAVTTLEWSKALGSCDVWQQVCADTLTGQCTKDLGSQLSNQALERDWHAYCPTCHYSGSVHL